MTRPEFQVWLFTQDQAYGAAAVAGGAHGVVVDWEWQDKERRQAGRDTEVNHGTIGQLRAMRSAVQGAVACRINNRPGVRVDEARLAAECGVDEVWLPMLRTVAEAEECLAVLPGGCRLGVLAETPEALALARELGRLPLARVYVGLNDLCITTGRRHLFSALVDGAVEEFRAAFDGTFGVAGITRPARGFPVPCHLLLAEMARLDCGFGVARRSFRRDTPAAELPVAIEEIRHAMGRLARRPPAEVGADRRQLELCVRGLEAAAAGAVPSHGS